MPTTYVKYHEPGSTYYLTVERTVEAKNFAVDLKSILTLAGPVYTEIKKCSSELDKFHMQVSTGAKVDISDFVCPGIYNHRSLLSVADPHYIGSNFFSGSYRQSRQDGIKHIINNNNRFVSILENTVRFNKEVAAGGNITPAYIFVSAGHFVHPAARNHKTIRFYTGRVFSGTVCPNCNKTVTEQALTVHMKSLKCMADTACADVNSAGYSRVVGGNVANAIAAAGIELKARPIEFMFYAPEWVVRAVSHYEKNKENLGGLTLTEFLTKVKPDDIEMEDDNEAGM